MAAKKGLGKGLDALFIDNATTSENSAPETVLISEIEPNRNQQQKKPRKRNLQVNMQRML